MKKKRMQFVGLRNRLRSFAIIGLVLAQTQLVLVAGLHWHPNDFLFPAHRLPACSQSSHPSGPAPDPTPCIVCQIVRQGAARPAIRSALIQLPVGIIFCPVASFDLVLVPRASTLPARAPPLT